jgi:hypothetical protein
MGTTYLRGLIQQGEFRQDQEELLLVFLGFRHNTSLFFNFNFYLRVGHDGVEPSFGLYKNPVLTDERMAQIMKILYHWKLVSYSFARRVISASTSRTSFPYLSLLISLMI